MSTEHSRRLLDSLLPLEGMRVVELGCGSGELAELLADAVGLDGRLLAGDVSERAVFSTGGRLAARPNATVTRFDADQIPCPAASADAVVAAMTLMMLARPSDALAEIHRVLRAGGRLVVSVWGSAHANPWLTLAGATLARSGLRPARSPGGPKEGGPFSLGSPDTLRQLVIDAGFIDVHVDQIDTIQSWANHYAYLESMRSVLPSFAAAIDTGRPEQRARLVAAIDAATHRFAVDGEIRMPVSWLICSASVG